MLPSCLVIRSARAASQTAKILSRSNSRQISCSSTPSSSGGIEPPNVPRLAQMARVGVTEEEAAEWGPKMAIIVEWFGQLQEVDVEGVPPALRATVGDANLLRSDQQHEFENRQVIIKTIANGLCQ